MYDQHKPWMVFSCMLNVPISDIPNLIAYWRKRKNRKCSLKGDTHFYINKMLPEVAIPFSSRHFSSISLMLKTLMADKQGNGRVLAIKEVISLCKLRVTYSPN